ncbi:hypothetical protein V1278_000082 [Bradyrhizobium sp. AZCC 1577]|jgi:hypothetical protein
MNAPDWFAVPAGIICMGALILIALIVVGAW